MRAKFVQNIQRKSPYLFAGPGADPKPLNLIAAGAIVEFQREVWCKVVTQTSLKSKVVFGVAFIIQNAVLKHPIDIDGARVIPNVARERRSGDCAGSCDKADEFKALRHCDPHIFCISQNELISLFGTRWSLPHITRTHLTTRGVSLSEKYADHVLASRQYIRAGITFY